MKTRVFLILASLIALPAMAFDAENPFSQYIGTYEILDSQCEQDNKNLEKECSLDSMAIEYNADSGDYILVTELDDEVGTLKITRPLSVEDENLYDGDVLYGGVSAEFSNPTPSWARWTRMIWSTLSEAKSFESVNILTLGEEVQLVLRRRTTKSDGTVKEIEKRYVISKKI